MGVDLTGITPGLMITNVLFILLILSMFSLAVIRAFQTKYREIVIYAALGIIFCVVFYWVLNTWFS